MVLLQGAPSAASLPAEPIARRDLWGWGHGWGSHECPQGELGGSCGVPMGAGGTPGLGAGSGVTKELGGAVSSSLAQRCPNLLKELRMSGCRVMTSMSLDGSLLAVFKFIYFIFLTVFWPPQCPAARPAALPGGLEGDSWAAVPGTARSPEALARSSSDQSRDQIFPPALPPAAQAPRSSPAQCLGAVTSPWEAVPEHPPSPSSGSAPPPCPS